MCSMLCCLQPLLLKVAGHHPASHRSSEWGMRAWHWYWTSALPRALAPALPLAFMGAFLDRRAGQLVGVAAAYVALYSYLPHKEVLPPVHWHPSHAAARSLSIYNV